MSCQNILSFMGDDMKLSRIFERCLTVNYTHAEGGVDFAKEIKNGVLYVYFQDSDGCGDWKTNLDFPAVFCKNGTEGGFYAHRGFVRAWGYAEKYVSEMIKDFDGQIVCTGYSHGGALALLCHGYIWQASPVHRERLQGFGFGAPRVLWGVKTEGIKKTWENFTVIRNTDDIVTHLPPAVFGFFHTDKMLEIGQRGKYTATDAHRSENILTELKIYEKNKSKQ